MPLEPRTSVGSRDSLAGLLPLKRNLENVSRARGRSRRTPALAHQVSNDLSVPAIWQRWRASGLQMLLSL